MHGERVQLDAGETKHARIRRLRRGDVVVLFDGMGTSYRGRIESLPRDGATVLIIQPLPQRDGESGLDLTLALAALKADRLEWVIEKATELGVTRIRPFVSRYSLARPSPGRQARWRQIALSAAKQCGRSVLPPIEAPVEFAALFDAQEQCRLLFRETGEARSLCELATQLTRPAAATVIIGPEGGLTAAEAEAASAAGCHLIGLGPRILRAETAAVTAVALCQQVWGDLTPAPPSARREKPRDRS